MARRNLAASVVITVSLVELACAKPPVRNPPDPTGAAVDDDADDGGGGECPPGMDGPAQE